MTRCRSNRFTTAAIAVFTFTIAIGPMSPGVGPAGSSTTKAAAPSKLLCNRNSAFCGVALRVNSNSGTIPSVAAGAHYGPEWGIPTTPNDSTGTGWCVDDTHTGYPAGTIVEQPLPSSWTQRQMRVAAAIISLYGGDQVLPYQGLGVDDGGELVDADTSSTNPTRHRHVAVWLALRSIVPDPAGTPRIDLASARTFADIAGRRPSTIGNPALPLAIQMVRNAEAMAAQGDITMSLGFADGGPPSAPATTRELTVRLTDTSGRPLPSYPVWPTTSDNTTVVPAPLTPRHDSVAAANIERSGWLSFDTSQRRHDATLTDASGTATFLMSIEAAAAWNVEFTAEAPPQRVRLFGDGIRAQNNVTLDDTDPVFAQAAISGDLTRRSVRVVKTSSDPDIGVADAVFALIDGGGGEIDRGTTATDGIVDFDPFDDQQHPPPYTVRELQAPPGLQALTSDVFVAADPTALATDPTAPTVIEIQNQPIAHHVVITKTISGVHGAPDDLSGFEFTVRLADTDTPVGIVTTDADGHTPPLTLPSGDYEIDEVARPEWWPPNQPLPDAILVSLAGVPIDGALAVAFDNTLLEPTITTFATDASDGDKVLTITGEPTVDVVVNGVPFGETATGETATGDTAVDGTAVDGTAVDGTAVDDAAVGNAADGDAVINDSVTVCGLVSSTTYVVDGELVAVAADGSAHRTGIIATAQLPSTLDDAACAQIDLTFDIPANSSWLAHGTRFVVTNIVMSSDVVVARHADLDSAEQSVTVELVVPSPSTTSPSTTTPPALVAPATTPPATTTTTTSIPATTTVPATTVPPTTSTTAVPTTSTPSPPPPTTQPPLPRTGGDEWRGVYRAASLVVFVGAALFFASTLGLGRTAMARGHSRRDPSRLPGPHATRTNNGGDPTLEDPIIEDSTAGPARTTQRRSRRDPSRLPGPHATRTNSDTDRSTP